MRTMPFLLEVCRGWDWDSLNKPQQKMPIRDAWDLHHLPPHVNLQKGDSGISEAFEVLTPPGNKSPVAFYNKLVRDRDARGAAKSGAQGHDHGLGDGAGGQLHRGLRHFAIGPDRGRPLSPRSRRPRRWERFCGRLQLDSN